MDDRTLIVMFRMGERLGFSVAILLLALVVMVAFWRSVQRVEFRTTRGDVGIGGTVVLATPIFVLLALILYAWVSLSNPISVRADASVLDTGAQDGDGDDGAQQEVAAAASSVGGFTGIAPGDGTADLDARREMAQVFVRSLNCLAAGREDVSGEVASDLTAIKLSILEPVWSDAWGEYARFATWAVDGVGQPTSLARAIWEETRRPC